MTLKYILSIILISSLCTLSVQASYNIPAAEQSKPTGIFGGTIHTAHGEIIQNGVLAFSEGRIIYVGTTEDFNLDTIGWEIYNAEGLHIYPGLIALNTRLGLVEIDQARPTRDFNETDYFNPNVRSITAYNTDSYILPTIRSNGILLSQIVPSGGLFSGTSSVVQLDAWNWEDAAYATDIGIHLNWPRQFRSTGWWAAPGVTEKHDITKELNLIRQIFEDAHVYYQSPGKHPFNLKLEAMKTLFDGTKKLFVHTDEAKAIKSAIQLANNYNIELVIVGGHDAYLIPNVLKENNVSVILDRTHRLPSRDHEGYDIPYELPSILEKEGIIFSISRNGSWDVRNLPFYSGTAIAHGLSEEAALKALTIYAAKILGIDDITGTLEVGKDANIVISKGNIFDYLGNDITQAFIQGRKIELINHQDRLYDKYRYKYGLDEKN